MNSRHKCLSRSDSFLSVYLSLFLPISERLFALTSSTLSGTIFCIPSTICFLTSVLSYLGMFCVLWLHTLVSLSFWLLIYQFSIFRKTVKNLYFYSTLSCLGSSLCSFVILFSLSVSVLVLSPSCLWSLIEKQPLAFVYDGCVGVHCCDSIDILVWICVSQILFRFYFLLWNVFSCQLHYLGINFTKLALP